MNWRDDDEDKVVNEHTLEPMGGRIRIGQPMCFRNRRIAEPNPKPKPRLIFLPPVSTRASFWLPLGRFAVVPQPVEPSGTDPHDDFAA